EEALDGQPRPEKRLGVARKALRTQGHVDVRWVDGDERREQPPSGGRPGSARQNGGAARQLGESGGDVHRSFPPVERRRDDRFVELGLKEVVRTRCEPEERCCQPPFHGRKTSREDCASRSIPTPRRSGWTGTA